MANGSFQNYSGTLGLYCEYSWTQNISGNYSDVTVSVWVGYWSLEVGSRTGSVTVNGTSKSFTSPSVTDYSGGTNHHKLTQQTIRVYHNSDGTKTGVNISVSWNAQITYAGTWYNTLTASTTINLPTIPRASSLSLSTSSVNVGSSITANISRASSSFTHTVEFYINSTYYQKYTGVATSQSFTIPTSWYAAMPSSTSCTAYCRITTYSGSTQIGSQVTKSFTVVVPSSIVPKVGTITLDPTDINSQNILVQNKNKITVSVSGCSAGSGSSIKSYTFSGPGISSTTTSTSVSGGPISNTGTLTYTVKVTDNRGRTASKSKTINCYAHSTPHFNSFNAYRVDSNGNVSESGTNIKCTYSISYSPVNNTNSTSVKIYYKASTSSSYSSVTIASSGAILTNSSGTKITFNAASTYTVYATVTDNYSGSSTSSTITVFGASRILNIRPNGTGISLGKMAESDNLLDVKWPIKSGDPVNTLQNFSYRGQNLISSTASDTITNWNNQGNLATTFYTQTGRINGQPSQYGFLLNLTTGPGGAEAHQLWTTQPNGDIFHRGGNGSGMVTSWKMMLDTSNYTNYVSQKPTTLYSSSTGNTGTVTLSSSAANFTYLEIFYTDNNTRQPDSVKVYSPNGKYVTLSCIEPSTTGSSSSSRIYIRTSGWTISGTSMSPGRTDLSGKNRGVYGQFATNLLGTNSDVAVSENNYIKIFRVLGYK